MVKSSDAIDIRPAVEWLQNPTIPADEGKQLGALFLADTNNDGFLENTEFAAYTSNPLIPNAYIEASWSQCKSTFLMFGIWQDWRLTNAHLMANSGQPKTNTQICSDLSQEVGPPFYGPSTTGFSARVFCNYTQSHKFGKSNTYEALTEQVLRLPQNSRFGVVQTALKMASEHFSYGRQASRELGATVEVGAYYLTAVEYTTLLKNAMQIPNPQALATIINIGVEWLPATERATFLLMGLENHDEEVRHWSNTFKIELLPENDRLAFLTAASKSHYADVRIVAIEQSRDMISRNDQLSLLQNLAKDDDEWVRRVAIYRMNCLVDASKCDERLLYSYSYGGGGRQ